MITVDEAKRNLARHAVKLSCKKVPLLEAVNCIIAEEVKAPYAQPRAHNSSMDGIAVNYSSIESGLRSFQIIGEQRAGHPPLKLKNTEECFQIYTGGLIPQGCQCVIPVEDIDIKDGKACVKAEISFKKWQFVRKEGQDYKEGDILIHVGERITPLKVSLLAALGVAEVNVVSSPRIAVISTGDELVEIDQPCEQHQVRLSNAYTILAILKQFSFSSVNRFHVKDDKTEIVRLLNNTISRHDLIITIGGVSMGKFDFIPDVLKESGFETVFHKIKERPGKPLLFANSPTGKSFFGLPGNPVSSQLCTYHYIVPFLQRSAGQKPLLPEYAVLKENYIKEAPLTYFLPVKIVSDKGTVRAAFVKYSGSGDYLAMAKSDGYVELSIERQEFKKDDVVPFYRWGVN
ncbi:MAG: molybdopterin molybdotransferase MoeA [Candidatus Omnitrophica bacterium]|nr:molybdopterin molybdotransferase MoeA [Candidatus Omnitrophota bacterium]